MLSRLFTTNSFRTLKRLSKYQSACAPRDWLVSMAACFLNHENKMTEN